MIHNPHIILGTKQRHINSHLDDRNQAWTMTSPAMRGQLVAKWVSILKGGTAGVVPDIRNEILISQQHLSKFDIKPFIFRRSASLEVIKMFHTSRNDGLHLSKESYVDSTICCLYMRSDVRHPGDPGIV